MNDDLTIEINANDLSMPLIESVGYNHFNIGNYLDWHQHSGYELTFAIKRNVSWELEDGEVLDLVEGEAALTLPNVKHRGLENITFPCDMIWIKITPNIVDGLTNTIYTYEELADIFDTFDIYGNGVTACSSIVRSMLKELQGLLVDYESHREKKLFIPMIRGLICQIILYAVRSMNSNLNNTISDDIRTVYDYIRENYYEHIDISSLAKYIDKSESYVYSAFKVQIGQTPNDFIKHMRIRNAMHLLRETDKSMTYIAMETGFSTSQYFSNVFKKIMGRTPTEFRDEIDG